MPVILTDAGEMDCLKAAALGGLRAILGSDYLALNVSPEALCDFRLASVLSDVDLRQIVLELTEHTRIGDYASILCALRPLREQGLRITVDDVAAGYANMRHILSLQPDLMKLDVSLTKDIDRCPARAALLTGLVHFGRAIGARTVAEGVETVLQLPTLRTIGIDAVQGYLFGHPAWERRPHLAHSLETIKPPLGSVLRMIACCKCHAG